MGTITSGTFQFEKENALDTGIYEICFCIDPCSDTTTDQTENAGRLIEIIFSYSCVKDNVSRNENDGGIFILGATIANGFVYIGSVDYDDANNKRFFYWIL